MLEGKAVALSTVENEFIALTETFKELIWYSWILDEYIRAGIIQNSCVWELSYDSIVVISF